MLRALLVAITLCLSAVPAASQQRAPHYIGKLVLSPDSDGRIMTLLESFGYADAQNQQWIVPRGAKTDGASIPRLLWPIIGGPFEGKFRTAAVIHDYYCDVRIRPWRSVHRMFYEAMRTSGVEELQAKTIYAGVVYAGPRWSETTIINENLKRHSSSSQPVIYSELKLDGPPTVRIASAAGNNIILPRSLALEAQLRQYFDPALSKGLVITLAPSVSRSPPTASEFQRLSTTIKQSNPSLDEIDRTVDALTKGK